jgi:hypothetical protein
METRFKVFILRFMVFHDLGPNKQQRIEPFGQKQGNSIQSGTKNHIGYVDIFTHARVINTP